jgi:hypothetical protein
VKARGWKAAVAAAAVVALALVASFELGFFPSPHGSSTTTVCSSCNFQEPVVDVIMPAIGSSGNYSNPNRVVNLTLGGSETFEVDIYPTVGISVMMLFSSVLTSITAQGSGNITATFQPSTLAVGANSKGVTMMTVSVPASAAEGTYDGVVSAQSQGNSSEVWGLYFQLVVT